MDRTDEIHAEAASMAAVVVETWANRNRHRIIRGLDVEARRDLQHEIGDCLRPLIARAASNPAALTPHEAEKLVPFRGEIQQIGAAPIKHPPARRGRKKAADAKFDK